MPKGNRGSRGKSKGRSNYVRLAIRTLQAPRGMTKDKLREILADSIDSGDYALPEGLIVELGWSNNRSGPLRYDEWSNAMADSGDNGRGWDRLLLNYLDTH